MKAHLESAIGLLYRGCTRAGELIAIYEYLKGAGPAALDCDDILRSAVVLAVSSFDLYLHDIYRLEALERLRKSKNISALKVPFGSLFMEDIDRHSLIDECIRKDHAYKSFVAPDKLAECLKALIDRPWDEIAGILNTRVDGCKEQLRRVIDLRNRIAHEADVNPNFGGLELWPIYAEDVRNSVEFLRKLALAIAKAVDRN